MKRTLSLLVTVSLGLTSQIGSRADMLTTSYTTDNSRRGNMFDLTAIHPITITSFDVNLASGVTVPMSVYYKSGTYVGNAGNAAAWTLLGTRSVTSLGSDLPTPFPIIGLSLAAGTLTGLFITTDGSVNSAMRYSNGNNPVGNADLALAFGYGTAVPFDGAFNAPRTWSGTIHYTVNPVPEPQTWAMCGVVLMGVAGYGIRRRRGSVAV